MTLALLWEEYRAATTDGFGYSWFCDLYRVSMPVEISSEVPVENSPLHCVIRLY
jgi:hypothetical protein